MSVVCLCVYLYMCLCLGLYLCLCLCISGCVCVHLRLFTRVGGYYSDVYLFFHDPGTGGSLVPGACVLPRTGVEPCSQTYVRPPHCNQKGRTHTHAHTHNCGGLYSVDSALGTLSRTPSH